MWWEYLTRLDGWVSFLPQATISNNSVVVYSVKNRLIDVLFISCIVNICSSKQGAPYHVEAYFESLDFKICCLQIFSLKHQISEEKTDKIMPQATSQLRNAEKNVYRRAACHPHPFCNPVSHFYDCFVNHNHNKV